jgi:DNA-binding transcriptional regulator YiaG
MNREDCRYYFEVLELPLEADLSEVKKAYLLLKETYSTESIVTMSVAEEVTDERRKEILRDIEEAYQQLTTLFKEEHSTFFEFVDEIVTGIEDFNGETLKSIREKLHISLDDMAMATRIQRSHLVNIEEENFAELPVPVYTRGFVVNYAKFLNLDPEEVAKSYMEHYRLGADDRGK